jgi:hypothetical protein
MAAVGVAGGVEGGPFDERVGRIDVMRRSTDGKTSGVVCQ